MFIAFYPNTPALQAKLSYGDDADDDEKLFVLLVQIFDRDGMFLHKFSVPDLKASTLAVDANRRIIVADSANRCIHVISLDTGRTGRYSADPGHC